MLQSNIPDETVLELYCMGKLEGPALEAFEELLLISPELQDRVEGMDAFLRGMRSALAHPVPQEQFPRGRLLHFFRMPVPIWATAAVAIACVGGLAVTVGVNRTVNTGSAPVAIALSATRGGSVPTAKASAPLALDLDARDLATGPCRLQVVNAAGLERWASQASVQDGHIRALLDRRLDAGTYFIRAADSAGAHREFALRLEK